MALAKLLATAGLFASFAVSAVSTASLPTISTTGSKFYDSHGNQFFIKGLLQALCRVDSSSVLMS
jgi:hypothetical protein